MMYNLIIHDNALRHTRLYGCYESKEEASKEARNISGKAVAFNPISEKRMRVDYYRILDDVEYCNN